MSTRIYTRTGDKGDTGLFGGQRVPKDHLRVEAYGTVDELNAVLGIARAAEPPPLTAAALEPLQLLLFELGAELATPPDKSQRSTGVTQADVEAMEREIDRAEAQLAPLKTFILPGGTPVAAALHHARTVCRRAERQVVALRRQEPDTSLLTVQVLNRMADLLFVLARLANHEAQREDVPWKARG